MRSSILLLGASWFAAFLGGEARAQDVQGPPVADADRSAEPAPLEEIVVTASRRDQSIREVPTAVSAFAGEKLREAQITSLNDLTAITPNVQISAYQTNANITIRGVGNGNFIQAGGDPGVAVHQNGVYLGQSALALTTFLDVQRVEILRGPQGTLFGRNATGGAINIIANTPTTALSYGADIMAGVDPTMIRSSAYLSGPVDSSAKLLGRVSIQQNYNQGFSRNRASDGPSRLDGNDDFAARGQLEWRPTEAFSARLLAEYQQNKDNGPAAYLSGTPAGPAVFPFALLPLFGLPPVDPITPPASSIGDPRRRDAQANVGDRDMNAKTFILTTDWAFAGGSLKAILSYNETYNRTEQDGDGTSIPFTATLFTNKARQKYGELLYASDAGRPFSFVVGANYYDERLRQNVQVPILNYIPLLPFRNGGVVDTESYAVFAHAEYKLLPSTRVFGGLRYSHDEKSQNEFLTFGLTNTNSDSQSWSRVTYEAGVSSDLSRAITAYAKYATGYKSGGYSIGSFNPPFDPETNSSVEAGVKGSLLGGAVQANIAAFHMKYRDLQLTQVQGLISAVTNAARAEVSGVEVESVIRPTSRLRIEASGSWLDATFDRFDTVDSARPTLGTLRLTGNDLPNAPQWAGSVGIFNDFPLSGGTITPGGRFDYKSRIYFSEFNIPVSSQDGNGRLNLYVNYKSGDSRWTGSIFALNVTDKLVKSNVVVVSANLGSLAVTQYQPGRQVGASLGYRF